MDTLKDDLNETVKLTWKEASDSDKVEMGDLQHQVKTHKVLWGVRGKLHNAIISWGILVPTILVAVR